MRSTTETGHAINVAHYDMLLTYCKAYQSDYNPSNAAISIAAMNQLLSDAKAALHKVHVAKAANDDMTNQREVAYKGLPKLFTRIINALEASGVHQLTINDVRSINNKMHGIRTAKKAKRYSGDALLGQEDKTRQISVSRRSFDSQLVNLKTLISILNIEPLYNPNETELKLSTLKDLASNLESFNSKVLFSKNAISNARIERDSILYSAEGNLYDSAQDVKKYIKSVFGAGSGEYKQISNIKFSRKSTYVFTWVF